MELHQLRYVVSVAETGNFSRAAEQCHVSQPSLSQQIQKLEEELGERLFDRLKRKVKLTPAGEAFVERAARILHEIEQARREAKDVQGLLRGTVVLGVLPTIAPYFLPRVLATFSERFPGIEVIVQEDTTANLLKLGCACELDVMVASLPIRDERLEQEALFREELLVAMPPDHRLGRLKKIILSDLQNERFILLKEGHCLGDQVLDFCHRRDFHPQVTCRSAQIETVLALVRTGLGISLVPQMAARNADGKKVLCRPLSAPRPARTIAALWPRQRPLSRAAGEFLKTLREVSGSAGSV